jgi:hypothetical protein
VSAPVPPSPYPAATTPVRDASVGDLIGNVASDLSRLMRQELALAKAETKQEVTKAGKGVGLLGGAGYAGLMLGIFASLTIVFLLHLAVPLWAAALIVSFLWAAAGGYLFSKGRAQIKTVNPTPTQTVNSLKETF